MPQAPTRFAREKAFRSRRTARTVAELAEQEALNKARLGECEAPLHALTRENLNMKRRVISFGFDSAVPMISMPSGKACHDISHGAIGRRFWITSGTWPFCRASERAESTVPWASPAYVGANIPCGASRRGVRPRKPAPTREGHGPESTEPATATGPPGPRRYRDAFEHAKGCGHHSGRTGRADGLVA